MVQEEPPRVSAEQPTASDGPWGRPSPVHGFGGAGDGGPAAHGIGGAPQGVGGAGPFKVSAELLKASAEPRQWRRLHRPHTCEPVCPKCAGN